MILKSSIISPWQIAADRWAMTFLVGHIIHYYSLFIHLFIYQSSVVEYECLIHLNVCYHVTTLFVDVISRGRVVTNVGRTCGPIPLHTCTCKGCNKMCLTSACNYARSWSAFCDVTLTWQIYASGRDSKEYTWHAQQLSSVSVQWDRDVLRRLRKREDTRDIDFVTFEIWVLVLAALLLALMTIDWIFVWCITHC